MRRPQAFLVALIVALAPASAVTGNQSADGPPAGGVATDYVIVALTSPPAASYEGGIDGLERTKPLRGRLDPSSRAYAAYRKHLENEHASFKSFLGSRAPKAKVVGEYFSVLNAVAVKLNGAKPDTLTGGPGVRVVAPSALYRPAMNVSPDLIGASEVWGGLGGQENAGAGIRVAVIDTGIDITSPFFDDTGLAPQAQEDECADQDNDPRTPDTNNKVPICKIYHAGVTTGRGTKPLPELCNDHGSHVAGTIGGRAGTSGPVQGTDVVLSDLSGVAPGVTLGSYNVFPCIGAGWTAFGGSAFSHDIARAIDDAVLDGMHVINMSLGGTVQGPHDLLAEASNAAVDAGVVVVVAAGNSGPGDATVESPGSAEKVITAGASTNPHFVGIPVEITAGPSAPSTIGAALGDFANFDPAITADYTVTVPANGCSAITNDVAGKIALIDRGVCTFTTKVRNAQTAGAVGVLVVNNSAGDPTAMAADGTTPEPTIPAAQVGKAEGAAMKPSGTVTVDGTVQQEFLTENEDIIAAFSSRGPVPFTYAIKPDLTAPGVNVASSVFGGEFAFFQGTSMATPHLSGVAALILDGIPGASPAEVKSRMANNAARVVTDQVNGTADPGVLARGGGRVDVPEAFDAAAWFDPVSVSFGLVNGNRPVDVTRTVDVNGAVSSVAVEFDGPPPRGVDVTATTSGGDITVTLEIARKTAPGDVSGDVVVSGGGQTYLIPFWVRITNR